MRELLKNIDPEFSGLQDFKNLILRENYKGFEER